MHKVSDILRLQKDTLCRSPIIALHFAFVLQPMQPSLHFLPELFIRFRTPTVFILNFFSSCIFSGYSKLGNSGIYNLSDCHFLAYYPKPSALVTIIGTLR